MLGDAISKSSQQKCAFVYTVTAWGFERPELAFRVDSAQQAYELVLNKAVYASLQVRVTYVMAKKLHWKIYAY